MTDRVAEGQYLGARETQEDTVRIVGERGGDSDGDLLLVLADGMGGHAGGEIASQVAVETFAHHFSGVSTNLRPRGRLSEALDAANAALDARIEAEPELRGMGCTLIATLVAGGRLVWVSVGDSGLYLLRNGRLRRLNADHSLFGELMEYVERGEMTRAEAEAHPRRNALRAALTGEDISLVDLNAIEVDPGDVVILASDGVETLLFDEIERIAQQARMAGPEAIRTGLLDAVKARKRPHQDNTSVLVLSVDRVASSAAYRPHQHLVDKVLGSFKSQVAVGVAAAGVLGLTALMAMDFARDDEAEETAPAAEEAPDTSTSESIGGGSTAITDAVPAEVQADIEEDRVVENAGESENGTFPEVRTEAGSGAGEAGSGQPGAAEIEDTSAEPVEGGGGEVDAGDAQTEDAGSSRAAGAQMPETPAREESSENGSSGEE